MYSYAAKLRAVELYIGLGKRLKELNECKGCPIRPACGGTPLLAEASVAFAAVFEKNSVKDLVRRKFELRQLLGAA